MKAPTFWYDSPGPMARLLAPLGWGMHLAGRLRRWSVTPIHPGCPTICVGNLVAGGTGKTPVALHILDHLIRLGIPAHGLTRGYGGRLSGPIRVDLACHRVGDVGDEALMLAAIAPTWVARNRASGALAARAAGAEIVVLDDGFQNPALRYDLSVLVVDGEVGFGNGRLIPAGPLREPVKEGLARAALVVVMGEDRHSIAALAAGAGLPVRNARLEADPTVAALLTNRRVFAFAGIGRPGKFFDTLAALGAELVETVALPDHHRFRPGEVEALITRAHRLAALPVTTTKDAIRLPPPLRAAVHVLPVTLSWREGNDIANNVLAAVLNDHGQAHAHV